MPDTPHHPGDHAPRPHELEEALLTAHALGQLDDVERAHAERLLADPARQDARDLVAETRAIAAILHADHADVPRLPQVRRAVLAALATATPAALTASPADRTSRFPIWLALAGSLAAALLVTVTLVPLRVGRHGIRDVAQHVPPAPRAAAARPAVEAEAATEQAKAQPPVETSARPAEADRLAAGQRRGLRETNDRDAQTSPPPLATAVPMAAPVPMAAAAPMAKAAGDEKRAGGARLEQHNGLPAEDVDASRRASTTHMPADKAAGERYNRFAEHVFRSPAEAPLSTFSIDVDTASYAITRRFLTAGRLPPPEAVRIEEFVNAFRYDYPRPAGNEPFAVALEAAVCPWRAGHRLVRIGLQGREIDRRERPAGNLVFLVDVSGSMAAADKLPLVKQALAMLVEELTADDHVAIVTYAGDAGLRLPPTGGADKPRIRAAIESLQPGGSTHGSAGILLAYEQAAERFIPGGTNRVILCTDGDLNVGVTSDAALVELIRRQAAGGTFLTVLGFGQGNLQDEKLEKLADNGNGIYAYVDSARQARKTLVEELTGSLVTIAKDVKIQVEFNPARVASYRLLGYENRQLRDADFRDDRRDAGEIGAGHAVTALYELVLVDEAEAPGRGAEPLKYAPPPATAAPAAGTSRELLTVKLRSKEPDADTSTLREAVLENPGGAFADASADFRFAAAVAAFGMILRDSPEKGEATLPMVATLAGAALGADAGGHRAEFLDLVRKAEAATAR